MSQVDTLRQVQQLRAKISAIEVAAEPLRTEREKISVEIERKKERTRELSRQILSIEQPMQELRMDLHRLLKLGGKVFALPSD
jgi:chromosome segregation ATPase